MKLSRVSQRGISISEGSEKIGVELRNTVDRFNGLLDTVLERLNEKSSTDFRLLFREGGSSGELLALIADFAKIKDFYLTNRDNGEKS